MTLSDVDGLALEAAEGAQALHMTEEAFRAFYERTARPLWAYLARATGEPSTADDLLQDAYYRLLRSNVAFDDDAHRRNYLFRIATNLVRDRHRRPSREVALPDDDAERPLACEDAAPAQFAVRREVTRALDALRPRDRDLLWLAYTLGLSHVEMARTLGVKTGSVKLLLFRARTRLATLLRPSDYGEAGKSKETVR
ncbi:MAG: sigma-70 family RNA polymerase sigma factor [Vicinamibacteria bacterium]|nr:sigma-70 family RNA polymerase sigma factor [Vicinamibacteria bacterium]